MGKILWFLLQKWWKSMKNFVKSTKFVIVWKPNFEILNPKIWILKSLTLKSQKCQNWIKNHPKSKFLTVDHLRIRFCIDIIFQIFSKFIRSWLDITYPNLKFWSPYIIKICKIHQNWLKSSKFCRKILQTLLFRLDWGAALAALHRVHKRHLHL